MDAIDELPGYRRRVRVELLPGAVLAALEDDYHCMTVRLEHAGGRVTAIEPAMPRAPWTTCPGAMARLRETFAGLPLGEVSARREKQQNCTHLHDLAVLAAVHAGDAGGFVYDLFVSDPVGGRRELEIRRNGAAVLHWTEQDGVLTAPAGLAGRTLFALRDWIAGLPDAAEREAARLLQWGGIIAHGRTLPPGRLDSAVGMPPNCYTFQPERIASARRIGRIVDFSAGDAEPLATIRRR